MIKSLLGGRLRVKVGDITEEQVDAVVNAANSTLLGGGGVDGAIHRRGGPAILEECRAIRRTTFPGGLPTGEAVLTTGGDLAAAYVIHTVGPIYGLNNGRDAELLAACYANSLSLAAANGLSTVSFPSISTGAFGYPKDEAARVVAEVVSRSLTADQASLHVNLVFFNASDARLFLHHSALR
jgi:O-acetyl-ADP-ribose deacetylase (regulator of RNase III)